jgi:hypothetical protein
VLLLHFPTATQQQHLTFFATTEVVLYEKMFIASKAQHLAATHHSQVKQRVTNLSNNLGQCGSKPRLYILARLRLQKLHL